MNLPLTHGALFIDNSFLEQLQTCPRLLEYNQMRRRVLRAARPSLNFGSAIHLALEHRYRTYGTDLKGDNADKCYQEQCDILTKFFADNPPPEDDYRTLNWALELVKRYNKRYSVEGFNLVTGADGKPRVEESFAIPFGAIVEGIFIRVTPTYEYTHRDTPVLYCGKSDLPILQDTTLLNLDHKTTSVLGPSFWDDLRVSPQQIGYCWAIWRTTGQMPLGFVVNAIRTHQPPAKPRNGIEAWWEETFQRNQEYLAPWHYEEWERNTEALIREFLHHAQEGYFPLKRKWCVGKYGRCQYYDVCYSPAEQRDMLLASEQYEDYTWSPLKDTSKEISATQVAPNAEDGSSSAPRSEADADQLASLGSATPVNNAQKETSNESN